MPLSRQLASYLILEKASLEDVVLLLTKYKLLTLLPSIKQALVHMSSGTKKSETIMIESPLTLSDESIIKIKSIIGNLKAPHAVTFNKNVLAGFKATYKGILYDGSGERIIRQLTQ